MKFIGQHIFDFIARFRDDVYLEDISTGTIASGGNLGLDANNKIVKADTEAGELSFNGSTTNGVLTYGNATTIDVESTFTYNSSTSLINIINSTQPQVNLDFSGSGSQGPKLLFNMSQASGSDNDILGTIVWKGKNDSGSGSLTSFVDIEGRIADASAGDEAGELKLTVLANSTEYRQALTATGLGTGSRVDIGLGHGTDSTTTIAGNLTTLGDDISMSSVNSGKPLLTLESTHTGGQESAEIKFLKNADNVEDSEQLGKISFYGDNDAGTPEVISYAEIVGSINDMTDGAEEGKLELKIASHDGELQPGLTISSGNTEDEVDVTIGNGTSSITATTGSLEANGKITVTSAGQLFFNNAANNASTRIAHSTVATNRTITLPDADGTVLLKDNVNPGKQFQVFQTNFTDDLNTSEVFIPLHGSTLEQTSQFADDVAILAPCDGRIVSLDLNILAVTGSGDLTVTIYSCPPGIPGIFLTEWTEEENEVISIQSTDDSHVFHFAFDNAKHFESTEKFALSIQSSADIMGNTLIYATAVVEFDYSTLLPATSAEFDSAP